MIKVSKERLAQAFVGALVREDGHDLISLVTGVKKSGDCINPREEMLDLRGLFGAQTFRDVHVSQLQEVVEVQAYFDPSTREIIVSLQKAGRGVPHHTLIFSEQVWNSRND